MQKNFIPDLNQKRPLDYFEVNYGTFIASLKEYIDKQIKSNTLINPTPKKGEPKLDRVLSEVINHVGNR